jgi:hypothetical protein
VTYDAVIDVDNADLKLKPGMTANCTFLYAEKDDALRVPNGALRFVPPPELIASLKLDARPAPTERKVAGEVRRGADPIASPSGCCATASRCGRRCVSASGRRANRDRRRRHQGRRSRHHRRDDGRVRPCRRELAGFGAELPSTIVLTRP